MEQAPMVQKVQGEGGQGGAGLRPCAGSGKGSGVAAAAATPISSA